MASESFCHSCTYQSGIVPCTYQLPQMACTSITKVTHLTGTNVMVALNYQLAQMPHKKKIQEMHSTFITISPPPMHTHTHKDEMMTHHVMPGSKWSVQCHSVSDLCTSSKWPTMLTWTVTLQYPQKLFLA